MGKYAPIPEGSKFGKWTVLGEDPNRASGGAIQYFVSCDCGVSKSVSGATLRAGRSTQCRSCGVAQSCGGNKGKPPLKFESGKYVHGTYFYRIRYGALTRGLIFDIDIGDMDNLWDHQHGKCALTGWSLDLSTKQSDKSTASLDRIDSSIGYLSGNLQWVHKDVNQLKMAYTEERFFEICQAVVSHKDQTKKLREGKRPWLEK